MFYLPALISCELFLSNLDENEKNLVYSENECTDYPMLSALSKLSAMMHAARERNVFCGWPSQLNDFDSKCGSGVRNRISSCIFHKKCEIFIR